MIAAQPLPAPQAEDAPTQYGLNDQEFAGWLQRRANEKNEVVIVHDEFLWKAYVPGNGPQMLVSVDPDTNSKKLLKALARKGLLKTLAMPAEQLSATYRSSAEWHPQPVSQEVIDTMVGRRLSVLGRAGRGKPISESTAFRVWADAGCRCMFEGCGIDLGHIPLYNKAAKVGYLAHIVGSDPRGPRGNAMSHDLADEPSNIMLMCDAHHRLIDSFAPKDFEAPRLQEMRAAHVGMVRRHLDALALPQVKGFTLLADLANVPTNFKESDAVEAVLDMKGNLLPHISNQIRRTQRDDRHEPGFWSNYLNEHERDICRLEHEFKDAGQAGGPEMAIFPIHHTPTLVLAGRLLGEAQRTRVYQYDRGRQTWRWDTTVPKHPPGTFASVTD